MNKKQLVAAAKDLSRHVDFDIDLKEVDQYDEAVISDEIMEGALILEDGDDLKQSTIDVLNELEVDIPAGLKIIKEKKTGTKKTASKKTTKKTASKKTTKKTETKKPGVISTIVDLVTNKGPITKEKILKELEKKFPDRDPKSMINTINIQLSYRMKSDKGLNVQKTDKGYMINGK